MIRRLLLPLFTSTLLVSAFLVFVIQPVMGKALLPLLGGSAAVWTTSLLFFQGGLLVGYLYAHLGVSLLGVRRHAFVHLGLLALSIAALPIALPDGWAPAAGTDPTLSVLLLLSTAVGIPFVLVSSTAPLVQAWFAGSGHSDRRDPYFLYAASNVGSLAALIGYPFVLEPHAGVLRQQEVWSQSYGLWIILVVLCGLVLVRSRPDAAPDDDDEAKTSPEAPHTPAPPAPAAPDRPGTRADDPLRWILLALVPSSLLLGVTQHMTTDLASVPLLWVVPLALYLLTFILAFARRRPLAHTTALRWQLLLVIPLVLIWYWGVRSPLATELLLHLGVFFVCALVCHGELHRRRPPAERLTAFYLAIALGGALGGAFNALLAPLLFRGVAEYPLALIAAVALRPGRADTSPDDSVAARLRPLALPIAIGASALLLTLGLRPLLTGTAGRALIFAALFGIGVLLLRRLGTRPLLLALSLGLILAAGWLGDRTRTRVVHAERSFYGVHRVTLSPDGGHHLLFHGTTLHGAQSLDPERRLTPITYYREEGPFGRALRHLDPPPGDQARRVGVLGLGTGTAACLGSEGERWSYFEIDPAVVRIASDTTLFTYLRDCPPEIEVIVDDGRRAIEAWDGPPFDLLIADAFTSDALPVHLITVEAIESYMEALTPEGVLLLHISNRHLRLEPVVVAALQATGLLGITVIEILPPEALREEMATGAQWVAVARTADPLVPLLENPDWRPLIPEADIGPWTDDHSDLLRVMRWLER